MFCYDSDDIRILANAFAFLIMCPILVILWDTWHAIQWRKSVPQTNSNEDEVTPMEEIASDEADTVSVHSDGFENRINDNFSSEIRGNEVEQDPTQREFTQSEKTLSFNSPIRKIISYKLQAKPRNATSPKGSSKSARTSEGIPTYEPSPRKEPFSSPPGKLGTVASPKNISSSFEQPKVCSRHEPSPSVSTSFELPKPCPRHGPPPRREYFYQPQAVLPNDTSCRSESNSFGHSEGGSSSGTPPQRVPSFSEKLEAATSRQTTPLRSGSNSLRHSEAPSSFSGSPRREEVEQAAAVPRHDIVSGCASTPLKQSTTRPASSGRLRHCSSPGPSGRRAQVVSPRHDSNRRVEGDNVAGNISPISTTERERLLAMEGQSLEDEDICPRQSASAIYIILREHLTDLEESYKKWKHLKDTENLREDCCRFINEVLEEYNKLISCECVQSLEYYLKEGVLDKDNFSQCLSSKYVYTTWWKVHERLEIMGSQFKLLDNLKRGIELRRKKRGFISADSSLLKETQSWAEKKKVKSPIKEEDSDRSKIPKSTNPHKHPHADAFSKSNGSKGRKSSCQ